MNFDIGCPGCGRTLSVPTESGGQDFTCNSCNTVMTVPLFEAAPPAEQPPMQMQQVTQEELLDPVPVPEAPNPAAKPVDTSGPRRPCPMCGEQISTKALKCRFCGEVLDPDLEALSNKPNPDDNLTSSEWVFGILCSGIACITSIVWMIQGKKKGAKLLAVSLVTQFVFAIFQAMAKVANHR